MTLADRTDGKNWRNVSCSTRSVTSGARSPTKMEWSAVGKGRTVCVREARWKRHNTQSLGSPPRRSIADARGSAGAEGNAKKKNARVPFWRLRFAGPPPGAPLPPAIGTRAAPFRRGGGSGRVGRGTRQSPRAARGEEQLERVFSFRFFVCFLFWFGGASAPTGPARLAPPPPPIPQRPGHGARASAWRGRGGRGRGAHAEKKAHLRAWCGPRRAPPS